MVRGDSRTVGLQTACGLAEWASLKVDRHNNEGLLYYLFWFPSCVVVAIFRKGKG